MKVIKKNVYYCDYCKKKNLSASAMKLHEDHCTANPNRKCRLCHMGIKIGEYVEELKKRFILSEDDLGNYTVEWIGDTITLEEVRTYVEYCPACTLSVLRQTKLGYEVFKLNYDYKKDKGEFWTAKNTEDQMKDYYHY